GLLSPRLIAAHCRCMSAEEERTLGAAGAAVAINPAIAARRGLAARIDELERAGCLITLGTDNMAEDMVEVVRTALFMERVRRAGRARGARGVVAPVRRAAGSAPAGRLRPLAALVSRPASNSEALVSNSRPAFAARRRRAPELLERAATLFVHALHRAVAD